jgi:hypothetical protein
VTPLADPGDLEALLGRPLDPAEQTRAAALLLQASLLVSGWCRRSFPDPPPEEARAVTAQTAARALGAPGAASRSETVGPFSNSVSYAPEAANGGCWLTQGDKTILARLRAPRAASVELLGG